MTAIGRKRTPYFFPISRQLVSLTSTSNFFAAALIRVHAASRSSSLTPFTWLKRAMAADVGRVFKRLPALLGEGEGALVEVIALIGRKLGHGSPSVGLMRC